MRPDVNTVTAYLAAGGQPTSWPGPEVNRALRAEIAAQAKVCRVPSPYVLPATFIHPPYQATPVYAGTWAMGHGDGDGYDFGEVVRYQSGLFIVIHDETGNHLPTESEWWVQLTDAADGWETGNGGAHADLAEALCRRVARNLALRALPLGFQVNASEVSVATTRIGADPEIRRLEAPFRRLVLG